MTEAAARARIEAWLAPIPGANPVGEDPRYDPLHEAIRNEAAKVDSPSSATTDWALVVKDAEKLTTVLAKDLLIESYAAFGLFQNEGLLGLAAGIFLLAESMDRYWDGMYPPARRIRARVNAIEWLTQKLDTALPETPIGPDDHGSVDALDAAVKRIRAVVADRFVEEAPALRPIADLVERMKMSLPERAAPSPVAPSPVAPSPVAPSPVAPSPVAPAPLAPGPVAEQANDTEPPPPPAGAAPAVAVVADAAPSDAAGAVAQAPPAPAVPPAPAAPAAPKEATPDDVWNELVAAARQWTEPCPGDSPAGIDAKYEIAHEELRADVAAADSPSGSALDWASLAPRAGGIVAEKSKDLLMAAYMSFGLWERDRMSGLALGLTVITQICERYWDDCYPALRRIRGRANALSWLLERLEVPLPETKLTANDKKAVAQLVVATDHFVATIREKFEDAAPSIRPLQDNVKRLEMSLPAPVAPAAAPAPAKVSSAVQSPAAAAKPVAAASVALGTGPSELADPADVQKFARDVSETLRKASNTIRRAAPEDPSGYFYLRLGLAVNARLPPAQEGSKTGVPPLPDQVISGIESAVAAEKWDLALTSSEGALTSKPFWFDANRYSAMALGRLGPNYGDALRAVIAGTALFVVRFPDALGLTFANGAPFCSELTREWINQEVMPKGGGGGGDGEGADVLAAARAAAAGGKLDEALTALQQLAHSGRSARARFLARLTMAQTLGSGKTLKVADSLFASLQSEIDRTSLETWEPELAADCYRSHLACLQQMDKEPGAAEDRVHVFRRLCRVDPLAAAKSAG